MDNLKDFELLPCKKCGQTNVGVKDEVLDINFELGNTIKVWAYCRNCGAVGKFRTIRQCDDDVKIKLAYKEWNSDKKEREEC